jgi:hypothetical protein
MIEVTMPKFIQPFYCKDLVRLGKDHDGGYLVNEQDVLNTEILISLGIGEDWSFEEEFTNIKGCSLIAYDGSLDADKLATNDVLRKRYSNFFSGDRGHVDKNIGVGIKDILFESVITEKKTFLKCDIEGSEYGILEDIIKCTKRFTGMVIEFHDINTQENFHSLINFISKIDQKLVHVHVNNYYYYKTDTGCVPDILELTFTSSSNIKLEKNITLPNSLDMPNNPEDEEFKINF